MSGATSPGGAVYVVSAVRTPIARLGGAFTDVPATTLGGVAIRAAVERGPVDPGLMRSLTIEAAARRFAELLSPLLDRVGR